MTAKKTSPLSPETSAAPSRRKTLTLKKDTLKDLRVANGGLVKGGLSKLDCQSKLAFTNTCINCSASTIF